MTATSTCASSVTLHSAPRLNILSLDGGGVRGLSTLLILQRLMERIREKQELKTTPLPCDIFDLIIGSATGGLIALMIGRLRMSVEDATEAYIKLSTRVFEQVEAPSRFCFRKPSSRYSVETLESAFEEVAKGEPLADYKTPNICRTAVVAVKLIAADDIPDLLRTYESQSGYLKCTISDAARATTAAMGLFPPATVEVKHGLRVDYLDGGLGYNNPAELSLQEAGRIWGSNWELGCLVSIGTGISPGVKYKGNKSELVKMLPDIARSSRKVHLFMEDFFQGRKGVYFRFDVSNGLNKVGRDEYERMPHIEELTRDYIANETTDIKFGDCVHALSMR